MLAAAVSVAVVHDSVRSRADAGVMRDAGSYTPKCATTCGAYSSTNAASRSPSRGSMRRNCGAAQAPAGRDEVDADDLGRPLARFDQLRDACAELTAHSGDEHSGGHDFSASGRRCGNRITSRIEVTPASTMTRRSTPRPMPPGRRQAVLERAHVVGVDVVRLLVAELLQRRLRLEPPQLVDRIVQLAERVGELATVDDELEAFGQRGIVAVHARERRHLARVVAHERRAPRCSLRSSSRRSRARACPSATTAPTERPSASHVARSSSTGLRRMHVDARRARVTRSISVRRSNGGVRSTSAPSHSTVVPPIDDARGVGDQLLGEAHHVVVVGERLVQLQHRELGVVPRRQSFVAEHARELEDPVVAADDEPLQVQLGRDAQEQLDVERVVMRR